ncbi:ABC transporter ATP-binding protein [Micromonospora sonneratiae]|uniref:ABC transporter ATP-binding protein n=1 Tax=Micromonospora sonneratiae TaxID=1184706 RepID=A0ABW3YLB4_9ACTN
MNLPVQTHGLTKRYGDLTAVDALSLSVRPGEVYGFLGPNGAGKTTTLRMLLGLVRPTAGTATLFGRPVGAAGHLARVGAMIEGPSFYPYLSGRDNLRVLARSAGVRADRVPAVLAQVDLADRAGDRYTTYSLGMKQRLGVAAALLKDPRLLILDEPTNGLDPAGMADMRDLIRRLGATGCTVLLSSHLLGEVQQICDRVGVVARGRLVAESSVAELRGATGLRVVAEPLDLAADRIRTLVGPDRVRLVDGALDVGIGPERAAWLNAELVGAGLAVSELRGQERDLEQVFFELTKGGLAHAG